MSLTDYLRKFPAHPRLTLVGPLHHPEDLLWRGWQTADAPNAPAPNPTPSTEPPEITEPVIWIDGGIHHRKPQHRKLGFAVGDGDSATSQNKSENKNAPTLDQYLPPDKDYSDLAYALRTLHSPNPPLPTNFRELHLLGFLGARRDHELFNLGEAHHLLRTAPTPTQTCFAHPTQPITAFSQGEWHFTAHGEFSIAVLETTHITLHGACKFPLPTPTQFQPLTSLGLSNRGNGVITLTTQAPAFVLQNIL